MVGQKQHKLFLIPILHQTTTYREKRPAWSWLFLIPILHQTTTGCTLILPRRRCFSFQFYIKPQQVALVIRSEPCCFSFQFYIKPQQPNSVFVSPPGCFSFQFYIKPQQSCRTLTMEICCFSFQFYIKPQRSSCGKCPRSRCFSFQFYIKPQPTDTSFLVNAVVSHSNSTSNHNEIYAIYPANTLFLIPILHQTTTEYSGANNHA